MNDTDRRGRGAAIILAVTILLLDQATKLFVLHRLDLSQGPINVLPVMDLTLVWNRGISYGLLQSEGLGRWLLVAFTAVAVVALSVWLWRTQRPLVQIAVGLIIGGAIGNLIDRVAYGAVVDFVHLYYAGFSWYVFNVADAAIVVGVVVLLIDSLFPGRTAQTDP
ncbi:signal peptidase II [Acuticoccus sp. M5D2P5]|uniref:signal peptidase II n=1 Tax=Acuticoccus kalidii TaxID=2910977 RepID=UPI001F368D62|nr:signal peptidase II [Acuticoccus kalidii]MCF3931887.1 signal peptidase II [Acuticoccus kalidii]